jgi:polysaccharide biosynthesis protein PslH
MTVLFFTEIVPFPVYGGEKLRTYGLLRILSKTFDNVIAVTGKTSDTEYKDKFKNIQFHTIDFKEILSQNKYIYCLNTFRRNKTLINLFERILKENKIDIVFIDYHYWGQYIHFFKSRGLQVIYGTHNVQSKITYQLPSISLLNKLSNMLRYIALAFHEWYYFRKADALIAVSENDYLDYKKYIATDKIFIIPNFLIEEDYSFDTIEKKDYVIMTANFGVFQNSAGLEWFLESIWSDRIFDNRQLLLVGLYSDAILKKIDPGNALKNVEALGSVEDIKPFVRAARVSVVPLLHGSGTRLKCIESMALKTQLVSTSKGAEGIEHDGSILIADSVESFKQKLLGVLEGKTDYSEKAYTIFINKYSSIPSQLVFDKIIQQLAI